MVIKDGTGSGGYGVKVDADNNLYTRTVQEEMVAYMSREKQQAFGVSTLKYTITDTETDIIVIKNNESEKNYIFTHLYISFDGGTTSRNKTIYGKIYKDSAIPTTGIYGSAIIAFSNMNFGSTRITDLGAYLWDGSTGTGLDGSRGTLAFHHMFSRGHTTILMGGVLIPPGEIIRFTATGEESSQLVVSVTGYLV